MDTPIGIDTLRFHVPATYLDLRLLAVARDVPYDKFSLGLGQELMAVTPPDEDPITLAANAAAAALHGVDLASLDAVILATESAVDASKAGATYLHRMLELPSTCRAFEVKQACCAGVVALQTAMDRVARRPDRRVLVVCSDIARYEAGSPAEPTQGAAAAAFIVAANPRLLALDAAAGVYTEEVMDFWRPPTRDTALVDGKLSIRAYLKALKGAYADYLGQGGAAWSEHARLCFHQPFTRLAEKALAALGGDATGADRPRIAAGMAYNRLIGNSYTASLFISLASMLETDPAALDGERLALFGYGSGSMGLFLSGTVVPGYRDALATAAHHRLLWQRRALDLPLYEAWQRQAEPRDGSTLALPVHADGGWRLDSLADHRRHYLPQTPSARVAGPGKPAVTTATSVATAAPTAAPASVA